MTPPRKRPQRLLVLLVALAVVATLAARLPESTPADIAVPVAQIVSEGQHLAETERPATLDLAALSARTLPSLSATLFGNTVAIPPVPAVNLPPPSLPAKPTAPPLPYIYLGQYRDVDGMLVFYLRKGNEVIVAKPGTNLDESYRLETDLNQGLTITYLPLKEAQIISIGNTAP